MKKQFLMPVISLLLICLVMSAAVSLAHYFTADRIARLEAENTVARISELLPDTVTTERDESESEYEIYRCFGASGELIGAAYIATVNGYGGEMNILVGLTGENTVVGVRILSSSETPGLGKKAENADFYSQFDSQTVTGFKLTKNGASAAGEIDAVTAATITSTAVVNAVNAVLQHYRGVNG